MKNAAVLLLISLVFSPAAFAVATYKTGSVTSIKMFSNVVVIYVDAIDVGACGSAHKRVAIKNDNPIYSEVVSSALTAKAIGSLVEIGYSDTCANLSTAWDFGSFWLK